MDVVTLATLCSIVFEPALMHALIVAESEAKTWSFRDRSGALRSFETRAEAVAAARQAQGDGASIRVGLTGLPVDLLRALAQPAEALFEPCPNVALASFRLERRAQTCRLRLPSESTERCALATYRGDFDAPDWSYADAILIVSVSGGLPNPVLAGACETPPTPANLAREIRMRDPGSRTIFVPLRRDRR